MELIEIIVVVILLVPHLGWIYLDRHSKKTISNLKKLCDKQQELLNELQNK